MKSFFPYYFEKFISSAWKCLIILFGGFTKKKSPFWRCYFLINLGKRARWYLTLPSKDASDLGFRWTVLWKLNSTNVCAEQRKGGGFPALHSVKWGAWFSLSGDCETAQSALQGHQETMRQWYLPTAGIFWNYRSSFPREPHSLEGANTSTEKL